MKNKVHRLIMPVILLLIVGLSGCNNSNRKFSLKDGTYKEVNLKGKDEVLLSRFIIKGDKATFIPHPAVSYWPSFELDSDNRAYNRAEGWEITFSMKDENTFILKNVKGYKFLKDKEGSEFRFTQNDN